MHQRRLLPLHKERRPSAAAKKLLQLLASDAREDGWIRNLVTVEMQDRQHRAVGDRIEELVGMPRRGERSGFRLAVADDARHDERGIVEHRAE